MIAAGGPGDVTRLLAAWKAGDGGALEQLMPLVYPVLKRQADAFMRKERAEHTLEPTALVHEAFLKLVQQNRATFNDRQHFFAVAARAMRQVLVDHARRHRAGKRGGGDARITLDETLAVSPQRNLDLLDLDRALDKLARLDERQARLVELLAFGGLTMEEAGSVLGCSTATISREWKHAEVWLRREMGRGPAGEAPS